MINNYNPVTNGGGNLPPYFDVILGAKKAQGSIASFESFLESFPIAGIKVNIKPVQEGSGDPSPDNIRPITGWTSCNIYHSGEDTSNPTVIPITFPSGAGTVYGGKLEINEDGSGVLTVDKRLTVYDGSSDEDIRGGSSGAEFAFAYGTSGITEYTSSYKVADITTNYLKPVTQVSSWNAAGIISRVTSGRQSFFCRINAGSGTMTAAEARGYLQEHPLELLYNLETPVEYPLTATQITTLLGTNNIWADTGNVEVTYGDYLNIINSRLRALESNS